MDLAARFREYAQAFEDAYADDDWSRLEDYFTENAIYDAGEGPEAVAHGRGAVLKRFENGVAAFDRRFDTRRLSFVDGPKEESGRVRVKLELECERSGLPTFSLLCTEIAEFEGNRISVLRDEFDAESMAAIKDWLDRYGAALTGE